MNDHLVEILPNLWLSGYKYALNPSFLKDKNIKLIINCTNTVKFIKDMDHIKKVRIPVDDNLQQDQIQLLTTYLDKTSILIENYYKHLQPILVHCYAGKQRSATIIAAYIMKMTKLDTKEIIALIQSKKSNAFKPSINFIQSLNDYHNTIK
jgi:dual specificity MAP kinase phosphatase